MSRWDDLYREQVREGFKPKAGVNALSHLALGLTGESGEVADLVKKSQYHNGTLDEAALIHELGDALWYLTALADYFGYSLGDIALANVNKLAKRRGAPYDGVVICTAL
jgi:NTP pyrophosphatase (non-canonical NTP hydrolase)